MKKIKEFLDGLTMYRLMLYFLRVLIVAAIVLSFFKILPYTWWLLIVQYVAVVLLCYGFNYLFAYSVGTKPNFESPSITGMILMLITGPITSLNFQNLIFIVLLAFLAVASKYALVIRKRHIFNPAAFGALATFLITGQGASWWVGDKFFLPFVLIGGVLVINKIRRWHLAGSFTAAYLILTAVSNPQNFLGSLPSLITVTPLLFFIFVMLPEPLTGPQDKTLRVYYGATIALFLFAFQRFLAVPYTLELSLLAGNVFARIVSPDLRLTLRLLKKEKIDKNIFNFWFEPIKKFAYVPGQFLEYTLPHPKSDTRGERRFFTIAASPSENKILISTRIADEKGSSFKDALKKLEPGDEIIAAGLEGNFVLPKDPEKKMVFIAGGIGITPFRSIIKFIVDNKLYRDIVLLYSNRTAEDAAFEVIFNQAKAFGIKTVLVNSDKDGYINEKMIQKEVPDWRERMVYVSGPEPMVEAFEKMLYGMGLSKKQVKRDYFPGYTDTHQA